VAADEVKMPGAEAYPNWTFPVAIAVGLPFFLLDLSGNNLRGLLAAMSAGSVTVVLITLLRWRTRFSFWVAIGLNVAAHYLLVSLITAHYSDSHFPGVALTPFMIADVLAWQFLTVLCMRKLRIEDLASAPNAPPNVRNGSKTESAISLSYRARPVLQDGGCADGMSPKLMKLTKLTGPLSLVLR